MGSMNRRVNPIRSDHITYVQGRNALPKKCRTCDIVESLELFYTEFFVQRNGCEECKEMFAAEVRRKAMGQ